MSGPADDDPLAEGLYEDVVTRRLERRLARAGHLTQQLRDVDPTDQPEVLTRHLRPSVLRALMARRSPAERIDLVAELLTVLDDADAVPIPPDVRQLLSVSQASMPGATPAADVSIRPQTPLAEAALLTNAPGEPNLGSEVRAELATSDGVDLLCAFVKWHGLRVLEGPLRRAAERGVPLRVITTTYLGGTERAALDRLVREYGADIRVQYDARRTRLHAKAWLFRRRSGFDTAYVGSSNLSKTALIDGVEWNVRLSRIATPTLIERFLATFDAYWNADSFEPYHPDRDADRLDDALAAGAGKGPAATQVAISGLQVRPYPHQTAILEALAAERAVHDRHRNLVVAATGTGKTIVAALDYQSLARAAHAATATPGSGGLPRLLFIAHRREILNQSLRAYREVLGDGLFGELYVDGARPERWQHVFASVQSLSAYGVARIPPDAFDIVVVDEFHHAEAPTYRRLLEHLDPGELLGLTATPERGDGTDVRSFFGGRTAADVRLWDAIEAGLLSPFHYFGIDDATDLTQVTWRAGRYDPVGLDQVYSGDDARARLVLREVADKIIDPGRMRALGFCVSVAHAHFMADAFTAAGLSARAVSGHTPTAERAAAIAALRAGTVNVLFAADLFNEGVDIPEVDTVLFLRPTDSPTLFLQQLGRGLRLSDGKAVLTVLDFVGRHRAEFRLDQRFRALTGATRTGLQRAVEHGFPFLPSGCQIVLDAHTQAEVLSRVRGHLQMRWPLLVNELRRHPTDALSEFLAESGLELVDVLKGDRSWTRLRREAGLLDGDASPVEAVLQRRVRAFLHVDDARRAAAYRSVLSAGAPGYGSLSPAEQAYARMLCFALWPDGQFSSYDQALTLLQAAPELCEELRAVIDISLDATRHLASTALSGVPLAVHARYQREEILAALGWASLERAPKYFREGVLRVEGPHGPIDAFLITLRKSERDYSPSTMYRDYPISPNLFHWESQSTTSVHSPTGRRYLDGSSTVLLFVRERATTEVGPMSYTFLGRASYVSHTGDRPIAITWRLQQDMPADLYAASALAV